MKFKQYLDEEYVTSFTAKIHSKNFEGGHTEIFKNPSKKEINDLIKSSGINAIRYWADLPNQDLYVWKADTVHYMVFDQLRKEGIEIDGKATVQGTAVFKNGKLETADRDCKYYDYLHIRNDKGLSLKYLNNYFEKGSFITLGD